ncbi:hypothetical protein ABT297_42745, partial [Dactylosporangium sp. NPDC000555]
RRTGRSRRPTGRRGRTRRPLTGPGGYGDNDFGPSAGNGYGPSAGGGDYDGPYAGRGGYEPRGGYAPAAGYERDGYERAPEPPRAGNGYSGGGGEYEQRGGYGPNAGAGGGDDARQRGNNRRPLDWLDD